MRIGYYNDLVGQKFGRLTVIAFAGKNKRGQSLWSVRCECHQEKVVIGYSLRTGGTKSCGCGHPDYMKQALGKCKGALRGSLWCRIKSNAKSRNIKVTITQQDAADMFESQRGICALSGEPLILDAPLNKQTASLDRIDSSKGYEANNIQWIHKEVNKMKNNLPEKELFAWIEKIARFRCNILRA